MHSVRLALAGLDLAGVAFDVAAGTLLVLRGGPVVLDVVAEVTTSDGRVADVEDEAVLWVAVEVPAPPDA